MPKATKEKASAKATTVKQASIPVVTENSVGRKFFTMDPTQDFALPNLIEVQLNSYEDFLTEGLKELLEEVSPIQDFSGKKIELHFVDHEIGEAKYSPDECRYKNLTYEAPLKVHVQLINKETGEIKEQDVFLGSVPLMTESGSFIVNGIERVVVSQIVRSPGVFFSRNKKDSKFHSAKIIPKRGAWLEIETDKKGIISVKIDRKRKIPATTLLRIFGYAEDKEILEAFSDVITDIENDYMLKTLDKDPAKSVDEAYQAIYKKLRPGDLATPENAKSLIDSMFFDYRKYDMGKVARYKINKRFGIDVPNDKEHHVFQVSDFVTILKHLIQLNNGEASADDIDHLSNRRIRPVGELVINKFRVGLMRTDRIAKDRMTVMDLETVTPTQLINSRPITAALREFFASSQLSQFMDQTNPLAELAHKRRISAMGPGGLSRERASFDVRDVHQSHYGRICPIATPEGPNIGLVVHLATYARVNKFGFIETPFRKIAHTVANKPAALMGRIISQDISEGKTVIAKKGTVVDKKVADALSKSKLKEIPVRAYLTDDIEYYDADAERDLIVAQYKTEIDELRQIVESQVPARQNGEPQLYHINDITHIDVSPQQIISETTSLIPFLENDDNTRASMGSNMQRQAVPLVTPQAPVVGTGMEEIAGKSSGHVILAEQDGTVSYVDGKKIIVIYNNGEQKSYRLQNFERSNQATALNQRARVNKNQKVKKGDVLADGTSTDNGELALGANLLVAYMAWEGYNYEDAIVISDRLVREGVYDSVHIETYTIDVRETKLGPEVITRDIPNVNEGKLRDLDENGIIRLGATVEEGDILVGKITPKGETELTAEERLLRAIFGDKARDVKDTSLRMPGGSGGKVVDIHIFDREKGDELANGVNRQIRVAVAQTRKMSIGDKMAGRHGNKGVVSLIVPAEDMPYLPDGRPVDICLNPLGVSSRMNIGQILETHLGWAAKELGYNIATPALNGLNDEQINTLLKDAELPESGKIQLFDGKTGEPFDRQTTVGIVYMLKLSHLVEDKIHARSVGPYSLVTQQPLGGKAQHGGQRFGEMEVWALEAYGAAHTLQEMLTIKSDDVFGRSKAYESIIKGESIKKPRIPESFNVLVKELQSLGLNVDLMSDGDEVIDENHEFLASTIEEEVLSLESGPSVIDEDEILEGELSPEEMINEDIDPLEEMDDMDMPIDAELSELDDSEIMDDMDIDMDIDMDMPIDGPDEPSDEELEALEDVDLDTIDEESES
ncbi:DNA-directed RNA polymerase subunit beta [Candidatus Gracilibacteria bacterium]|jgi:DNA-directed RNA polymerase subunit beta|nr:DNA-directed RNA polymerase subunit beta [Candidatus Gracilibacteria bacterium]